ncbi:pyrroline-5-carboxylate reductase [Pseudogulbenkiania sp. MAI-1]|uniref:pyrroline-5-carboxylate reductase n=1 Tax=Pseudogulbenkiania sp. MAI-1 TaxID=990370 RepID=UPI00045E8969|nr:pyrroline-5-carboxylate reductase [Pseudogulbenkiania sp. MAI-1]
MSFTITFIGGGNMARAIIGGLASKSFLPQNIHVIDPNAGQIDDLVATHHINGSTALTEEAARSDVIIWAIKPQIMKQVASSVQLQNKDALHISIAAGIRTDDLAAWTGNENIVRIMPNTPALIGAGVSGIYAGDGINQDQRNKAELIAGTLGSHFWLANENEMDDVTAISGSGPAYIFHFLEGYQNAIKSLGYSDDRSRELAIFVAEGALALAKHMGIDFKTLREQVTSKGGTTEAAIKQLDACQTQEAIKTAIDAAKNRAIEMSKEFSK